MKKNLLALLALNIFFVFTWTFITWGNYYITSPIHERVFSQLFYLIIELSLLNALILVIGAIRGIISKTFLTILLCIYFVIFITQALSVSITGSPVVLAALYNINEIPLLLNATTITIVIVCVIALLLSLYYILVDSFSKKAAIIYILCLSLAFPLALKYKHSNKFRDYITESERHQFSPPVSPFRDFYHTVKLYLREKEKDKVHSLSKDELIIAEKFNISIHPINYYPFLKHEIYRKNLIPSSDNASKKINVIVFFVESLSARLLGVYGNPYPGLTPNIDEFSQHSMVVTGYYNHTTPTMPGLFGQHCSLYPTLAGKKMKGPKNPIADLRTKCYPKYFSESGYQTLYFSHTKPGKWHIDQNLGNWGYKERYFWKRLVHKYLGRERLALDFSGASDHQMMRSVVNFLQREEHDKPFLLGVSTIETHVGFDLSKDGVGYANKDNKVLNMAHNLDDAFGIFWNYFKHSKYRDNTIVVLTADHAAYNSKDYMESVGKDWKPSVYDSIALIIHDPIHNLSGTRHVTATSIDLAPTLLQLANINRNQDNAFLGTSLFDPRPHEAAFGISPYPDYPVYISIGNRQLNTRPEKITNSSDKEIFLSLKHLIRYYDFMRKRGRLLPDTEITTPGNDK